MRAYYKLPRLYAPHIPPQGQELELRKTEAHYLLHVLRLKPGQEVLLFDGKSGEWRAACAGLEKKSISLLIKEQTRSRPAAAAELIYAFAPLKQARLDYMAQKAVEMGATRLCPVLTKHTQISRLNNERLQANIIEAAEQCGILTLPAYDAPQILAKFLQNWQRIYGEDAKLIFCDEGQIDSEREERATENEAAKGQNPLPALLKLKAESGGQNSRSPFRAKPAIGVLIGPEGGFSETERALLYSLPFVASIALGPRIMRADTAAVAALALVQAALGDW